MTEEEKKTKISQSAKNCKICAALRMSVNDGQPQSQRRRSTSQFLHIPAFGKTCAPTSK